MSVDAQSRSRALDGLRGIAVLQVVIFHYYLLLPIDAGWYRTLQRLGNAIDGVTLFFVLSGFLIGGILLDTRESPSVFRVFYARRMCRILPLYGLLLVTYGAVWLTDRQWHLGFIYHWYPTVPFWSYLVFWQNEQMVQLAVLGAPWLMVTWSLAVEQQFYLIAPWVIRYVSDRRLLLVTCGVSMLVGTFHRVTSPGMEYLLIDRIDALAAGVMLALIMRDDWGRKIITQERSLLRLLVVVYLLTLATLRLTDTSSLLIDNLLTSSVMYALLIGLLLDRSPWLIVSPALEILAPIGLWSYFIYLFHLPVAYLFMVLRPAAVLAALPVTVGLATLSYRYFEQPLTRWGHRFRYQPVKQPQGRP